jgi:hypothetical protein
VIQPLVLDRRGVWTENGFIVIGLRIFRKGLRQTTVFRFVKTSGKKIN